MAQVAPADPARPPLKGTREKGKGKRDVAIPEDSAQRAWHFKQLRWSLQSLAAAGSDQRTLFPDHAVAPDDLAFDFDHWASVIRSHYETELFRAEVDALAAIDQKLATMSRDGAEFDAELWTDAALTGSEHWADVRRLASVALEAFGWSVENAPEIPGDRGTAIVQ